MTLPSTYQKLVALHPETGDLRTACSVETVDMVMPSAGEILVKTHYTGVNAADYLMSIGRYLSSSEPPFDLGAESVGEVVAVGEGVEHLAVGDAILSLMDGGFRDYFITKARFAIPIPSAAPEVISLGVSGLTASIALDDTANMKSGETVLVTAAAGGTGSMAVQLAKIAGCTVIGTCGNDDKAAYLQSIGCDRPINYRSEDVKQVLKDEYPDGVDIVFEGVGGDMFDLAVKALAVHGRLLVIGAISEYEGGPQAVTRPRIGYSLMNRSASIRAFWLMNYFKETAPHMQKLLGLVQDGSLKLNADDTSFKGASGAMDALEYMYAGKNIGKVVVDFTG
ncbi:MAG: zinc-binding dehydrogenase [Phototrophicaceae bacterium]